jgi:hypothetical protein
MSGKAKTAQRKGVLRHRPDRHYGPEPLVAHRYAAPRAAPDKLIEEAEQTLGR